MPTLNAPQTGNFQTVFNPIAPSTTSARRHTKVNLDKVALWYFLGIEAVCLVLMLVLLVQSYLE